MKKTYGTTVKGNELFDLLLKELKLAGKGQNPDGSFREGCNGPYGDSETPIRNTAHFLFSLSTMYELTQDQFFYDCAKKASDYILNNKYISSDGDYICRIVEGKDSSNGVIGHAWIIEALLKAEKIAGIEARETAVRLWKLHSFEYNLGAWAKPSSSRDRLTFDNTFNHQLWFAACIAPLALPEVDRQIKCFLKKNLSKLETYKNGVIYHKSPVGHWFSWSKISISLAVRKLISPIVNPNRKNNMYFHSAGYHTFNLYALGMLKDAGYGAEIASLVDVSNLLRSIRTKELMKDLLKLPKIGIRYNPSGVEAAYALQLFGDESDERLKEEWLEFQVDKTQDEEGMLVRESPDKATSAARLYEATKLLY